MREKRGRRGCIAKHLAVALTVGMSFSIGLWAQVMRGPLQFDPPPSHESLKSIGDLGKAEGVVILDVRREYTGIIEPGFRVRGATTSVARFRYLVLDAHGVESISRHSFFSEGSPEKMTVIGRTISPDGKEYALDPAKDIKEIEVKDALGRSKRTVKTAFFPHVEPGSVLDLSYVISDNDIPDFVYVPLQYEFPALRQTIVVQGSLYASTFGKSFWSGAPPLKVYWVPFFTGPVPLHSHARLSPEFDLELAIKDAAAFPDEMFGPPAARMAYGLGLMPRIYPLNKEAELKRWHQDLILFGPEAQARQSASKTTQEGDIDPAKATVSFDAIGLQKVPSWADDASMMTWWQEVLDRINSRLEKFFRRDPGAAKDLAAEAEKIAPRDMQWRERAKALFLFVRSKVKPDPEADDAKTLARLLHSQGASERDLDLLYIYLCEKAGLQARLVIPMSRYRVAFTPILESFRTFGTCYMVEVSANGEMPLYVMPGDVFATFDTFPQGYLGALAFRQPSKENEQWPMFQIPTTVSRTERTIMDATVALDPEAEKSEVRLDFRLEGAAAWSYRWDLGWKRYGKPDDAVAAKMKKAQTDLVDSWSGLEWEGALPEGDHRTGTDEPFRMSLKVPAHVDIENMGERVIVPCLLRPYLASNFLRESSRTRPLWLPGGSEELSLTWEVPQGLKPEALPSPLEQTGPGGLRFKLESSVKPLEGGKNALTTRISIDVPEMLPASDYQGVKAFFEALKRACDTKVLFARAPEPGQEKWP